MIVQVAPVDRHVNETLCSLNFAQRVRSVELGAVGKKMESAEMSALRERLAHYEVSSYNVQLLATYELIENRCVAACPTC